MIDRPRKPANKHTNTIAHSDLKVKKEIHLSIIKIIRQKEIDNKTKML